MAPLVKERMLYTNSEEECKDDTEMIVSTDACAKDTIITIKEVFCPKLRFPQDSDFQGMKSLLKEIFPNAHLDLDSLIRLIISRGTCLVLKRLEGADEINDPIDVYGVSAIVGVKRNVTNCILQLRDHLLTLTNEYAPDSIKAEIKHIIEDDAIELELLLNVRDTYLAAEMAITPIESLYVGMQQAKCELGLSKSTYFIYICNIFRTTKKHKKNENLKKEKIRWINLDEKVLAKQATYSFEFSVDSELVNGLPDKSWTDGPDFWNPDDYDAVPYRRVLIFEYSKLPLIINKLRKKFNYYGNSYLMHNTNS